MAQHKRLHKAVEEESTTISVFVNLDVRDLVLLRSLILIRLIRPFVTGSDESR
jgi:hypothetical protein